jgi:hypothetical protein
MICRHLNLWQPASQPASRSPLGRAELNTVSERNPYKTERTA